MPLPWLQLIDAALGIANFTRGRAQRSEASRERTAPGREGGRLDLEREQMALEQARADRALTLELLRQAGDREIGRLRFVALVAVLAWIGTLFLSARWAGGTFGVRVMFGGSWALLIGALACAFAGQSRITSALSWSDGTVPHRGDLSSGVAGAVAPWLVVAGLAAAGIAVLLA